MLVKLVSLAGAKRSHPDLVMHQQIVRHHCSNICDKDKDEYSAAIVYSSAHKYMTGREGAGD